MTTAECLVLDLPKLDVTFIGLYRSLGFSGNRFCEEFENLLKKMRRKNTYIKGDLNIDVLKDRKEREEYISVFSSLEFTNEIDIATRFMGLEKSCLDHVLVRNKESEAKNDFYMWNIKLTDHFPIIVRPVLDLASGVISNDRVQNCTKREPAEEPDWKLCLTVDRMNSEDINYYYKLFATAAGNVGKCGKTGAIRAEGRGISQGLDWVGQGILDLIQKKRVDFRLFRANKSRENQLQNRKTRNSLTILIRKSKSNYYIEKFWDFKNKSIKQWDLVDQILGSDSKKNRVLLLNFSSTQYNSIG